MWMAVLITEATALRRYTNLIIIIIIIIIIIKCTSSVRLISASA